MRQIVRSENLRVSVDRSDPGIENFVAVPEHKITKASEG
jgi:hypothetical protein